MWRLSRQRLQKSAQYRKLSLIHISKEYAKEYGEEQRREGMKAGIKTGIETGIETGIQTGRRTEIFLSVQDLSLIHI